MAYAAEQPLVKNIKAIAPAHLVGDLIQPGHPFFGVIWANSKRVSGTPCFYGTRVPLRNLFDYLEGGDSLAEFLEGFPGVTHEQAVAVLELAQAGLLAEMHKR